MTVEKRASATQERKNSRKRRSVASWVFSFVFFVIALCQIFYWVFANRIEPMLLGMPVSMFFVTCLVLLEFSFLVIMYFFEDVKGRGY